MNYGKMGNIINNLPVLLKVENTINPSRIYEFQKGISGEGSVIYLMERELRISDNFALRYAEEI